jgi:hypothetical protein
MLRFLSAGLLYALVVNAHMELIQPLPFRSQYDPLNIEIMKDYSMTNPLLASGMLFLSSPGNIRAHLGLEESTFLAKDTIETIRAG